MADAQKGHKSWIGRLDQTPEAGADESGAMGSGAASEPVRGQGGNAEPVPTTWHQYLDSSLEPSAASSPRPNGESKQKHMPQGGPEPGQRQQAAPNPNVTELQRRWLFTQAQLLDDPREAVLEAGRLIGDAMRLASSTVEQQRTRIEREWRTDANVDTDELRSAMQRYRSLFQYVLAADELVGEVEAVRREHRAMAASQPSAPAARPQPQDGLAEVLHPGRAARIGAETAEHRELRRESPAPQWIGGLSTAWSRSPKLRWIAGAALLLLVGLSAAYGWWRWQGSASRETARHVRALTVEPLRYYWHDQGWGPLGPQARPTPAAAAAQSQQPEATRPPAGEPTLGVAETAEAAPSTEEQPAIRLTEREPESVSPEIQPATATVETAALSGEDGSPTVPETLLAEADPSPQEPTLAPVDEPAASVLQAISTPLPSTDLSQIVPVASEPERIPTESQAATRLPETATAIVEQEPPSVPQAPPAARQPEPEAAAPAVRRGDLVPLTDAGVARPVLLVEPIAEYPAPARRMRREATVALRVLVDERGLPSQIQPAGQNAGLGFDEAARNAVARARWRPATKDGVPVKVWIQTAVRFQLDGR